MSRSISVNCDTGVAQVDVEVLLLGSIGEPADLTDERDALGQ